jgi:hypothetical protein
LAQAAGSQSSGVIISNRALCKARIMCGTFALYF